MKKEKDNPPTQKENEMEQNAEKEVFRLPILLLLTALGVISMIEIRAMGWWSQVPLSVNIFLGMQAYEKWEKGNLGFGFMLRGVILMMVIHYLTVQFHWWSLLLTPLANYAVLTEEDVE